MNLPHPLAFLPLSLRRPVFWSALVLTALCFALFGLVLDPPLRSPLSSGIVSFELARTPQAAQAMLNAWDARARLFVAFSLGFDFLFMPLYATALSAALLLTAERLTGLSGGIANLLGWGAYLATLFDALENIALFSILTGTLGSNPAIAFGCATIKFGLLLLACGYALFARFFLQNRTGN